MRKILYDLWKGFSTSWRHLAHSSAKRKVVGIASPDYFSEASLAGTSTIQYPHQKLEVPSQGRYQLHVEIDDCIVCDLCAKICPVDCIDISSIKSPTEIGLTSDGSKKRLYAEKFDIDMSKCMYCGLCTIVCPTECITMTAQYDRSFTSLKEMNYTFATLSPEEALQKRKEYEFYMEEKVKAKATLLSQKDTETL